MSCTKDSIIIIGTGGHASSVLEVIESSGQYRIEGFVSQHTMEKSIFGYPVIGTDQDLADIKHDCCNAVIGIGQIRSSEIRKEAFISLKSLGFHLPSIIAHGAHVSKRAIIGEGSIVMHQAVVNANVCVADNCIVNNFALLEHDVRVGSHSHISTRATLNGGASIGENCFVGSGALIKENVSIGTNTFVAMGTSVVKDVPENTLIRNNLIHVSKNNC